MPEGNKRDNARRTAWLVLRNAFPTHWATIEKGLDRILEASDEGDLRLDAIGYAGQLEAPALVGLTRLLMDVGRGQMGGTDALDSLKQYRTSGRAIYPGQPEYDPSGGGQPYLQTPGLQAATDQFLQGLRPGIGPQMAIAQQRAAQGQQQGLLGHGPMAMPPAAGGGDPTAQQNWDARAQMLRELLAQSQ